MLNFEEYEEGRCCKDVHGILNLLWRHSELLRHSLTTPLIRCCNTQQLLSTPGSISKRIEMYYPDFNSLHLTEQLNLNAEVSFSPLDTTDKVVRGSETVESLEADSDKTPTPS